MSKTDEEVFSGALEFESTTQQEEWISLSCGNDTEQAARVRKLLRAHERMKQSDDQKKVSLLDRADDILVGLMDGEDVSPGRRIGAFEIVEKIGEGGVGVVFRARQIEPITREVALKLIKPGMDSQRILARFALERQVLGQLDHAGITRIYEAGVQSNGRPYFAMQLVHDALSLIEYCETFSLDLRTRIRLLISVCDAVQHAHQRGVIHRDLKPSNILVQRSSDSGDLCPKVIDFGIAKVFRDSDQQSTAFTSQGERFGTPAYMSPEQALDHAGGIDIRSDVYSLGAVLYELITGVTPRAQKTGEFSDSKWTQTTFWSDDIIPPSKSHTGAAHVVSETTATATAKTLKVPVDLDWISMKALATNPEDRFQTVADLQRDLERFLAGEPVEAAGPSLRYRISKFVSRYKLIVTATALLLATIVTTSILTTSYAIRASRAEADAKLRLEAVLSMQEELTLERDLSNAARRKAQTLLRVFQVQSATARALGAYYENVFRESLTQENTNAEDSTQIADELDADQLVAPHPRLIVRGDWSWAAEPFPDEVFIGTLQLSSRQLAQAIEEDQMDSNHAGSFIQPIRDEALAEMVADASAPGRSEFVSKFDFQDLLLEELQKIVGEKDPFMAEVLDTRGLLAFDKGDLETAETCLQKAVSIWQRSATFKVNAAQSSLFLAEIRSKQGNKTGAQEALANARELLSRLPDQLQEREQLLNFSAELSQQLGAGSLPKTAE